MSETENESPKARTVAVGEEVVRIEKLKGGQGDQILFSVWKDGQMRGSPLAMTETELIALLQAAVQEGILSQEFMSHLRSAVEI